MIIDSIQDVKNKVDAACKRCGRNSDEVKLIAVSKTLPISRIKEAYEIGHRIFGESRAQEVREKTPELPNDIEWHFIGPLQTNKIKYVLPVCQLIHSVDSLHLAEAISEYCKRKELSANILLEVNTSGEQTKKGINPDDTIDIFIRMRSILKINLKGLMTIAPFTDVEDDIRNSFKQLAVIKKDYNQN